MNNMPNKILNMNKIIQCNNLISQSFIKKEPLSGSFFYAIETQRIYLTGFARRMARKPKI